MSGFRVQRLGLGAKLLTVELCCAVHSQAVLTPAVSHYGLTPDPKVFSFFVHIRPGESIKHVIVCYGSKGGGIGKSLVAGLKCTSAGLAVV